MKVAYMLGSLNRGGLETLMLDVFRNASMADYNFIGVYRKSGLLEKEFVNTGVPMFKLNPKNVLDIGYLFKLRRVLKENDIDVVHSQTAIDAAVAIFVTFGTGVKVVTTYHSGSFSKRLLTGFAMKHVNLNLYVSKYQRDKYLEVYGEKEGDKHKVLYNGLSFDKFTMPTEIKNHNDDVICLGMVGNFTPVRSQMFVCRFLRLLKEKGVSFKFYFVGSKTKAEPYLYDDCVAYCEKNGLVDCVDFLGSRNDVPQLLQQWDAYVYSTIHDSFGISVIEAISSGLPTFVNDWPVMEEIIEGTCATLYKSDDENDLLVKFMDFLNHKNSYRQHALTAAAEVRKRFGINGYIRNLSDVYRTLR